MFRVKIFIETSHKSIRPADGWYWAVVEYITAKGPATIEYRDHMHATWNQLELTALSKALKALKRPCETEIYTENRYISGAITQGWLKRWQENGWKTEKGEPVKHRELWETIHTGMALHWVNMRPCEGHEYKNAMKTELKKLAERKGTYHV